MFKIDFKTLCLDHIVIFKHEDTVFACGRENSNGRTRLFLVFGNGEGKVYSRNGRTESWEILQQPEAKQVRRLLEVARSDGIPTYLLNGSCREITATA
jgi:hypothetical protein